MAANRRRTERSESAAERVRKAPLSAPGGRKKARPGAPFLKGRHKFAI